jgi:hypothetical protein
MTDIIELIMADHRRIRRLQAGLRAAARVCGSEPSWVLPRTWDGLAEAIEAHLAAQEAICSAAVSVAWPDDPAQPREVAAGGGNIRAAIAAAARQPAGSPGWWRAVNDALRDCSCGLDREERGLLAVLARHADPALRDRLGRQWLAFLAARTRGRAVPSPRMPSDAGKRRAEGALGKV